MTGVQGGRGPPAAAGPRFPWQFAVRAVAVTTGLFLLLLGDVHGAAFYVAWSLIVLALLTEGAATAVYYFRRARGAGDDEGAAREP
jgi:hypothetical protein